MGNNHVQRITIVAISRVYGIGVKAPIVDCLVCVVALTIGQQ